MIFYSLALATENFFLFRDLHFRNHVTDPGYLVSFVLLKIGYEFDFMREADAMKRIGRFLKNNNKRPPVLVPRLIGDMVTRYVCMHFI